MLAPALIAALLFAPPQASPAPPEPSTPASEDASPSEGGEPSEPSDQYSGEFGPLAADPDAPEDPDAPAPGEASQDAPTSAAGYGELAPLQNYGQGGVDAPPPKPIEAAPGVELRRSKKKEQGFQEPEDFGPFFEPKPVSEVEFPGYGGPLDREEKPFASVAGGLFCFVEDSRCGASLIADVDVGVGINMITSSRGLDVPYTQLRFRGGLVVRPLSLARRVWHPWGVGVVGSYSIASPSITATTQDPSDPFVGISETGPITAARVAIVNQLWLSQRRNALHLDFSIGGVNSSVLNASGRYWGSHAELGVGLGGWGGLFFAGDFLDQDTRLVLGMRGHGIFSVPMVALILLGLVAGGVAL
ncbi:hypothetical protein G6O69_12585 [Pseudenhygromyxa sp. WMMC2535]|uniref:hypothetical protein n=1 Tax=Pseudenhygromyxa sp. WMMC2535 TaxID=2712867 RepID=UPI00155603F5|nr:hypothetical protein [Pseudenhygromyxa sp. WMMC2535]NVB38670.1 hypothetical protein [Pseudenhygromyxa sp. WMMC2535]